MLLRTHLAVSLFFILLLFQQVQNPVLFAIVCLIATAIPDIDTKHSKIGHHNLFRIFNLFSRHRGMIHSFSILAVISIALFLFYKEILFPFALGYSLHLIADAVTLNGIIPFYPLKFKIRGKIRTGGIIENFLFIIFFVSDLILLFSKIYLISK